MTTEEALQHFQYTAWASHKLMDAVKDIPGDSLTKPLAVSHDSILGTLAHTFFADSIWYMRAVDPQWPRPNPKEVPPLDELTQRWTDLLQRWEAWIQTRTNEDLEGPVSYRLLDGTPFESKLKEVVLHVVNHGTLHRGQVVAMLRQVGVKPPATDLIFYYRERAGKA